MLLLLTQRIEIAVGCLLEFTVAHTLFGKLQLQRLAAAPDLIQRAYLWRNLRA